MPNRTADQPAVRLPNFSASLTDGAAGQQQQERMKYDKEKEREIT
jgi:hypothetical protein